MIFTAQNPFVGTAKQFETANVHLNGKALDPISIGALARHGLIEDAGEGPKPSRGRTPRLYRVFSAGNMTFTQEPVQAKASQGPAAESGNTAAVDTDPQA